MHSANVTGVAVVMQHLLLSYLRRVCVEWYFVRFEYTLGFGFSF